MADRQYTDLCADILTNGKLRPDRTNIGTRSVFGRTLRFDLRDGFPLLTTKRVAWNSVVRELLWFLRGDTNSKTLEGQGVPIWKGNSSAAFLVSQGLNYPEGLIGPGYGHQYRSWGASYEPGEVAAGKTAFSKGNGIDQVAAVVESLTAQPHSRRHVVSAWNVSQLDQMALPPCHPFYQLYVDTEEDGVTRTLDLMWVQRSVDVALGLPFNIASYALLLSLIAHSTGYKPRYLIGSLGDVHIYSGHEKGIREQMEREPKLSPSLTIDKNAPRALEDVQEAHIRLVGYESHPIIRFQMAV